MIRNRYWSFVLCYQLTMLAAAPMSAVDGAIEINQAKAMAGGVSTGDDPGFPVWITRPGSYVLTGNLTDSSPETNFIEIRSWGVTLDLNGFAIVGPVFCQWAPGPPATVVCSETGSGIGIQTWGDQESVIVKNGTVSGVGGFGIACKGCRVENVHANSNGSIGIDVKGLTLGCRASTNGQDGFQVTGTISDSVAVRNGFWGFNLYGNTAASHLHASENLRSGIYLQNGSSLVSSTSAGNGVGAAGGAGVRVESFGGGLISGCAIRGNIGVGIEVAGDPAGYGGNVITSNNGGNANPQVSGLGFELATNLCGTDTTCP